MSAKAKARLKIFALMLYDAALLNLSLAVIAFIVRYTNFDYINTVLNPYHFIAVTAVFIFVNFIFKLYKSIWTFADIKEIISCFNASLVNSILIMLIDKVLFQHTFNFQVLVTYDYIIIFVLVLVVTSLPRLGYRVMNYIMRKSSHTSQEKLKNLKRVMIVGAGYMGNTIINDMKLNQSDKVVPVVAVDDNPGKKHKLINGVEIAGNCNDIPMLAEKYNIDEIIITIPSATKVRINEIIKIAIKSGKPVKTTPSLDEILNDGASMNRIRKVNITDLLARDEVKLDKKICSYLIEKTILVTGGGGSIGSELCAQCARYNPKTIVIFDINENSAFELANELNDRYAEKINIQIRIGSVRDVNRLNEVFEEFHPDVVFHAAAHKHVPLMEDSPCEAVKNNVFGTYNVAITADKFKVPKMVILSTDKAVNPTNVMGATKRITEIIVQYMNDISESTKYTAVRFGNVLGSHGSVIPIFERQIERGGPIKVTHPDITRYFMTIPEAAQLVCQAGGLAKGGEVFVLDMGEPVKIMDLAENLITLSGFTVDEIGIEITGLRPGEKLFEELSLDEEIKTRQKTANEKIFVNQPMVIDKDHFESMLNSLKDINNENVREKLMTVVQNYHPAAN